MTEAEAAAAQRDLCKSHGEPAVVAGKRVPRLFVDEEMREQAYDGDGVQIDESTMPVSGMVDDLKHVAEGDPVEVRGRYWTVESRNDVPGSIELILKTASNY